MYRFFLRAVCLVGAMPLVSVSCTDPVSCVGVDCPVPDPVELRAPDALAHQEEPSIVALPSGRIVAAWKEMPTPGGVGDLGVGWSDDRGRTWTTGTLPEASDGASQSDPWLVSLGGPRVAAARYAACRVGVSTSADGGARWTAWQEVGGEVGCADKPSLTVGETGLHLLYHVILDGEVQVHLVTSVDGGVTWGEPVAIPGGSGQSRLAPVAVETGDRLVVAWWRADEGNIEVVSSADGGEGWSDPTRLNDVEGSVPRMRESLVTRPPIPSVTAVGNAIVVGWPESTSEQWDAVLSRSTDEGAGWSTPDAVSDGPGDQWMISLTSDVQGRLHAAWYDDRDGPTALRYATSPDLGRQWVDQGTAPEVARSRARLGDYLGLTTDTNGGAWMAWTAVRGDSLRVFASSGEALSEAR